MWGGRKLTDPDTPGGQRGYRWVWGTRALVRAWARWLRLCPRRLAKSTLTLIPLLGVHEVVFAFVTDEHAQGTLRSAKLFFDLFLSSFQVPSHPITAQNPGPEQP